MVEKDAVSKDFRKQALGYGLTTAEIVYRRPDRHWLLQTYVWQDYDMFPDFPALKDFLAFWEKSLEGPCSQSPSCIPSSSSQPNFTPSKVCSGCTDWTGELGGSVAGRDAATNCGAEVQEETQDRVIKAAVDPDRHKLANGPTVDASKKSTQGGHLLDRNSITFNLRKLGVAATSKELSAQMYSQAATN